MGNLRTKPQKNKINREAPASASCASVQYPWFSFRSMTRNSRYNLEALSPGTDREKTLICLIDRLDELSRQPWLYWLQQPKKTGLETIHYHELNFSANDSIQLSKDAALYVFRFDTYKGSNTGRIIGYKIAPCAVLQIIGYDFDFSAYNHGH